MAKPRLIDQESETSCNSSGACGEISELPTEALRNRIAEAAYYRAERRGFSPGNDMDDWLEAENEIQALHPSQTSSSMSV